MELQLQVLISSVVCLAIVFALATPAVLHLSGTKKIYSRIYASDDEGSTDEIAAFYEDLDGVATKESEAEFTRTSLIPKTIALIGSLFGSVTAIVGAVFVTTAGNSISAFALARSWSLVAAWILILVQAIGIFILHDPVRRFRFAVCGIFSSLILTLVVILNNFATSSLSSVIVILQLVAGVTVTVNLACLPRRPDVYFEGRLVDQQRTVSVIGRLSFSWAVVLLQLAKKKTLDLADLPQLALSTRSKTLAAQFEPTGNQKKLWRLLVGAHASALLQQWSLTLLQTVFTFAPQFFLLRFLQELERHEVESFVRPEAWIWVFGLGASLILRICVEEIMRWLTNCKLEVPVQAQISQLVFQKVMRRQDSHNAEKAGTKSKEVPKGTDGDKDDKAKKTTPDKAQSQLRQSVINHMKLDSARVTMFCTFNSIILSGLLNLVFASTFLITLIGWKSLLAGCLSSLLVIPITARLSKVFGNLQFSLMGYRDRKASLLAEALRGIRQIKFSALEQVWEDKIMEIRDKELKQIWKTILAMSGVIVFMNLGPLLLTTVALSVFTLQNGQLTPSVAFTCIGLFDNLRTALGFIPLIGAFLMEGWTSITRLEKFFNEPEKLQVITESDSISFEDATVSWPRDEERDEEQSERSILRNINLQFPKGQLSVLTGKTGSGKSLLLSAILGEVRLLSGIIKAPQNSTELDSTNSIPNASNWIIPSSVAFVSQTPWIENETIKENILFGLPFDSSRYQKTLSACALEKDLELFTDGDMTEVGPKGITLSGGQRWRIGFARVLYSRAGVLLLDDILSAVDAHVGRWILDNALTGELAEGRTRILATHHAAACLSKASYMVQLADGTVKSAESVDLSHNIEIGEDSLLAEENILVEEIAEISATAGQAPIPVASENKIKSSEKEEKKEVGRVTWKVYKRYLLATGGWPFWGLCITVAVISQLFDVGRNWWLKLWTESYSGPAALSLTTQASSFQIYMGLSEEQNTDSKTHPVYYYVAGYAAIILSRCIFDALKVLFHYTGSLRASRRLYSKMMHTVLRAPLRWLDTVPSGRILNRFTSDFATIDLRILQETTGFLSSVVNVTVITITSVFVSFSIIPLALVTVCLFSYVAWQYVRGAREIKRVNSIASSPIYDQLGSVLEGLSTVRAFGKTQFYIDRMSKLIDNSSKSSWYLSLLYRWMNFRMSILGAVFATVIAATIMGSGLQAALAGFFLSFALQYTQAISAALQSVTQIELGFNAVERIVEYTDLPTESEKGMDIPASWPAEGRIEFEDLVAAYAEDLPPVLKGLNFSIDARERVGVVGRTGAGKSSLANALFRFISAKEGNIRIDNIDISTIKLQDLRSRLAIIPQDPFLFSGTLRSNLDVYEMRTDEELKAALQHVHLIQTSNDSEPSTTSQPGVFEDLSMPISDGGLNLSQGQRQLVCLARAILSRPKILMLDEATSAVDMGTDAAIQQAIRTEFSNSTLLVIAHRLSTIADFDKVLVMSEGTVAEYGRPADLLKDKGMFYDMICQSAESEKLEKMILGDEN